MWCLLDPKIQKPCCTGQDVNNLKIHWSVSNDFMFLTFRSYKLQAKVGRRNRSLIISSVDLLETDTSDTRHPGELEKKGSGSTSHTGFKNAPVTWMWLNKYYRFQFIQRKSFGSVIHLCFWMPTWTCFEPFTYAIFWVSPLSAMHIVIMVTVKWTKILDDVIKYGTNEANTSWGSSP